MPSNCDAGENRWESLRQQDQTSQSYRESVLNIHWKTDAEAEGLILWPPDAKNQLIRKDPYVGKDWRQEEKGTTESKMVGWHHRLNGHEFEATLGGSEEQGSLSCCIPWDCKKSDRTERVIWSDLIWSDTTQFKSAGYTQEWAENC